MPLLTTALPSKPQGLPEVPHAKDVGASTPGVMTSSLSSPPASASGSNGAHGQPSHWFWARHPSGSDVLISVAVCGVSVPSHAASITSPWCTRAPERMPGAKRERWR